MHPYLLIAGWEEKKFRDLFPGSLAVARLSSPLATFRGSTTQLFDLVGDTGPAQVIDVPIGCAEPVPARPFRLSR
jgi:hypothetical protein